MQVLDGFFRGITELVSLPESTFGEEYLYLHIELLWDLTETWFWNDA